MSIVNHETTEGFQRTPDQEVSPDIPNSFTPPNEVFQGFYGPNPDPDIQLTPSQVSELATNKIAMSPLKQTDTSVEIADRVKYASRVSMVLHDGGNSLLAISLDVESIMNGVFPTPFIEEVYVRLNRIVQMRDFIYKEKPLLYTNLGLDISNVSGYMEALATEASNASKWIASLPDRYFGLDRKQFWTDELRNASRSFLSIYEEESIIQEFYLTDLLNHYAIAYKNRVKIDKLMAENFEINSDLHSISRVLDNLLSNAYKYGRTVLCENEDGSKVYSDTADVSIYGFENKDYYIIMISDKGEGVPEEMLDSIFNMDERLEHHIQLGIDGSGVGLASVKELIESLGGTISVENNSDEEQDITGLTFIIRLPKLP